MKTTKISIDGIPSLLWGERSDRAVLAVHGNLSNKADVPIAMLADAAGAGGWQTVSFDLPGHGDRRDGTPCMTQDAVRDIAAAMTFVKSRWGRVWLFANSMGAYFSMLALCGEPLEQAMFLSPIVDMPGLVGGMMAAFGVTPERLAAEKVIPTAAQTLYWEDYRYIMAHPAGLWPIPTHILAGEKDSLCSPERTREIMRPYAFDLRAAPDAQHYFHTQSDLAALSGWLGQMSW